MEINFALEMQQNYTGMFYSEISAESLILFPSVILNYNNFLKNRKCELSSFFAT